VTPESSSAGPDPDSPLVSAARRVLEEDGRSFVLLPWQIAYCFALVEGREPIVPAGCGVGKGWLDARLRERSLSAHDPSDGGRRIGS